MTRSKKICAIEGCEKLVHVRGWCAMHHVRWKTHGDTSVCTTNRNLPMETRFWMKVEKGPDCWNWTASTSTDGYGRFTTHHGGKTYQAHRFAYELLTGPIPEEKVLDHRCHNRKCVNPAHLRPVTLKQNREHLGGPSSKSTTGVLGVSHHKKSNRYHAVVGHNGDRVYGGSFTTIEEAAVAVLALRLELFTHNDVDRKVA